MLRRKMSASRKVDRQLCMGTYLPSGAQQLVASSLSSYVRMYICMLSEPQVSEAPQVAQFTLRTRRRSHKYL